jgi:hypothetical protein
MTGIKSHERKYVLRMPESTSQPFFITIVVVQNVPLLITESSMSTRCDVTESDVTGSDVIRIDSPWGVILIVRGAVLYSKGVFYHVCVLTGISTK